MNNKKRELIERLMVKSISKEKFLEEFLLERSTLPIYIKEQLEIAFNEKHGDDVEYLLFVGFAFKLFSESFVDVLCKLLAEDWHVCHEDIASIFQQLESPHSVESLYKGALAQFKYLEFDEAYALAVKCIWALWAIYTPESRGKLELLSKVDNEIIKNCAIEQLNRMK